MICISKDSIKTLFEGYEKKNVKQDSSDNDDLLLTMYVEIPELNSTANKSAHVFVSYSFLNFSNI